MSLRPGSGTALRPIGRPIQARPETAPAPVVAAVTETPTSPMDLAVDILAATAAVAGAILLFLKL